MMSSLTEDRELKLAKLLRHIDESADSNTQDSLPAAEETLEKLSEEQLQALCQATHCLKFLDRIRKFDNAKTLDEEFDTPQDESPRSAIGGSEPALKSLGRYRIIRQIGEGGFARVFLANDPALDRNVALKVLRPRTLSTRIAIERFRREAKAAATLQHPAIITVYETGFEDGLHYISMAYCPGETLATLFEQQDTAFDAYEVARIGRQVALALSHAHSRGIVHRDVKPSNLLLENLQLKEGEGISQALRITDFGLVKFAQQEDQELTTDGAIVGTPAYMSPEQALSKNEIDHGSDLFSLGTILYQLLTGELPHRKQTTIRTLNSVVDEEPKSLNSFRSGIPKGLAAIVHKCLKKEPRDRYESAFALAEDLDCWLNGRPVAARPIGQIDKFVLWVRRNPAIFGALALAFISLAIGLGVSTWQWRSAVKQNGLYLDAKAQAETKSKHAKDSLDLLVSSFSSLNSGTRGNADVTAKEVLISARQQVAQEYADDPTAQLDLLESLARSFHGVGDFENAMECRVAIYDILNAELGENHDRCIGALLFMSVAQYNAGELVGALESREKFVKLTTANRGEFHEDTVNALNSLGEYYRKLGRYDKARDISEQSAGIAELLSGGEGSELNDAMLLSESYRAAGLLQRAIDVAERELESAKKSLGAGHPNTLSIASRLATSYFLAKKKRKAIGLLESSVDAATLDLGPNDPTTLRLQHLLAVYLSETGNRDRGVTMMKQVLQASRAQFSKTHPQSIDYLVVLGNMQRSRMGMEDSIELHKEAIELCKETFGNSHHRTIDAMLQLARDYSWSNRLAALKKVAGEAINSMDTKMGPDNVYLFEARQLLCNSFYLGGQSDKAVPLGKENLQAAKRMGHRHMALAYSRRRYIYSLLEAGHFETAESIAQEYLDGVKNRKTERVARNLLAQSQLEQGKLDLAEATIAPALAEEEYGFPSVSFANCLMGTIYMERQKTGKAIETLLPALKELTDQFNTLRFPHQRSMVIRYCERAARLLAASGNTEGEKEWKAVADEFLVEKQRIEMEARLRE